MKKYVNNIPVDMTADEMAEMQAGEASGSSAPMTAEEMQNKIAELEAALELLLSGETGDNA